MNDQAPGLRNVFTHAFGLLISIFSGCNKFAQAFEASGDIVLNTVTDFRDEEVIKSAAKRTTLTAQLDSLKADLATES